MVATCPCCRQALPSTDQFAWDADGRILVTHLGKAGPIAPRTARLLHALIERSGEVVSNEECVRAVYGGELRARPLDGIRIVLHLLRKDLKRTGAYVENVPRGGYRIVFPVVPPAAGAA